MTFQVFKTKEPWAPQGRWLWTLEAGSGLIAASPTSYSSEAEARSAIASVKKSMGGAKFAKVVTV